MKRAFWMLLLLALIAPTPALADDPVLLDDPATKLKKTEITISFEGVTVAKAVEAIAKWGDVNIVVPASLKDTQVSLQVKDVSAWQALQMIAKQTKHVVLIQPGSSVITLSPRLEGEVLTSHSVHRFDLKDFGNRYAAVLEEIRREAPGARIIESTGARKGVLTVAASKQEIAIITGVIARMRTQVNEELEHLVELSNLKQYHAAAKAAFEAQLKHLEQSIAEARKTGKVDELRQLEERLAKEKANAASEMARVQKAKAEYDAMIAKVRRDATGEPRKLAGGKAGKRRAPPKMTRIEELKRLLAVAEASYDKARQEKRGDDAKTLHKRVRELKWAIRSSQAAAAEKAVNPFAKGTKMPKFEMVEGEWKYVIEATKRRTNAQLDNLKKAYDALKKAGMHQQATEVAAKIRAVEQDIAKRAAEQRAAKSRRGAAAAGGSVLEEVRALREEIHGLRAEVQMLNALVKKLLPEREPRRRR